MKLIHSYGNKLFLFMLMLFVGFTGYAQDKKMDVDINVNKEGSHQWYMNPIAWVIGGAVFILLLVALLRGNRSRD